MIFPVLPQKRVFPTWSAPTLVVYGDVVLSGDRAVAQKKPAEGDDPRKVDWTVSSAGGQAPVAEGKNLCRKQPCIGGTGLADGQRSDRHARRHLGDGEKAVETL